MSKEGEGMFNADENETREEYIRRLAYNRYQLRIDKKHKLSDTALSDWLWAEDLVRREEIERELT